MLAAIRRASWRARRCAASPSRLLFEIDVAERAAVGVTDDETRSMSFESDANRTGRREAAVRHRKEGNEANEA
jgi:hypothetical protein